MKYFVDLGERTVEVDVEASPDGSFRVRGPRGEQRVDYLETTAHEASLLIDGRSRTFWFSETNGTTGVSDGRHAFEARVQDERARLEEAILGRKMTGRGSGDVRAVMPGIVTRILVQEGEAVRPGTPLLCIEAMKMENEVKAEVAGVVSKLLVAAGRTVQGGEALVRIAAAAEA